MATAAREILEQRGARNFGAISLEELYDTMKAGGFDFENKNDQIAKRKTLVLVLFCYRYHETEVGLSELVQCPLIALANADS